MFEVLITEIRKKVFYVDDDFDFNAERQIRDKYDRDLIRLTTEDIVDVLYETEEVK